MLTCQELTEIVTDYLEGRMSLVERMRFQMHVGMCKACRAYLKQMKQTIRVLGGLPEHVEMPADVKDELIHRFRDWNRQDASGELSAEEDEDPSVA